MRNPGSRPYEAAGKRVNVVLACGKRCENWAADTTRWSRTGHSHDIDMWEFAK
jgi:hypothetical protein